MTPFKEPTASATPACNSFMSVGNSGSVRLTPFQGWSGSDPISSRCFCKSASASTMLPEPGTAPRLGPGQGKRRRLDPSGVEASEPPDDLIGRHSRRLDRRVHGHRVTVEVVDRLL